MSPFSQPTRSIVIVAIAGGALGFGASLALYAGSGALYGFALSHLGRAGYLLLLE